jgi:hypothetical protein
MVTITEKCILIEIPGPNFGADDIEIMQDELIEALEISTSAKGKTLSYYWLFQLLKAIVPNREQLEKLYPDRIS